MPLIDRCVDSSVVIFGFDKIECEASRKQTARSPCLGEHRLNLIDALADDVDTSCPKHRRDNDGALLAFRDRPNTQRTQNDPL